MQNGIQRQQRLSAYVRVCRANNNDKSAVLDLFYLSTRVQSPITICEQRHDCKHCSLLRPLAPQVTSANGARAAYKGDASSSSLPCACLLFTACSRFRAMFTLTLVFTINTRPQVQRGAVHRDQQHSLHQPESMDHRSVRSWWSRVDCRSVAGDHVRPQEDSPPSHRDEP